MRTLAAILICAVLQVAAMPGAYAAGEPPTLSHNPFSRPSSEVSNDDVRIVDVDDASGPTLALRATMVGPASRLANVGGHILKAGDEIRGYVLVAVHEDYAVFRKSGELTTVYVKPQLVEDDD